MGSESSKSDKFVKDAEDVVNTMKFMNNVSKLFSHDKQHAQSQQRRQNDGQQGTSRGEHKPTTQRSNYNHYNPAPQSAPNLERTRTPYSFTNSDLDNNIRQANSQRLYPNLDNVNRNLSPQPTENERQSNNSSGLSARSDDDFVILNRHQARMHLIPSAPPAADVIGLPETAPAFNSPHTQPRYGPSNPGPSNVPHSVSVKKAPRSESRCRGRALDPRFNCPTCAKRLGLTIYNCSKGHGSCKECKESDRVCGSESGRCGAPITGMRNITLEAYVAEVNQNQLVQCENDKCTLSFNIHGMKKHLQECPFGVMNCPMGTFFGQCSARCKVDDLASHFDACHKDQRAADFDKEMFLFNICMESHKLYFVKNGPYNFLVHVKVCEQNRMVYMAVQLLGTAVSASKWTYEWHVYNKRQPRRKFQYIDICQSIGTPLRDIFAESKCAAIPVAYAMSFVNESALTYKFFIKKTGQNQPRRRNNEWKRQN